MTRPALLALLLAFAACDKLPERPEEAKFRAADDGEKCRLTAARAILCTNELIVADLKAIGDPSLGEMTAEVQKNLDSEPLRSPAKERKENIALHKSECGANEKYADAVFECWAIEDCKKFADCVNNGRATAKQPRANPGP
jgi:hypothetical protein